MGKLSAETKVLFDSASESMPRDSRIERASRAYRASVGERQMKADDEANKKKKLEELVLKWAEEHSIALSHWTEKKQKMQGYVYRYGDVEARVERPEKWATKVLLGDEVPEPEGDASAVVDDDAGYEGGGE